MSAALPFDNCAFSYQAAEAELLTERFAAQPNQDGRPLIGPLCTEIEEGSFTLITGATGCGKTTLLRCLNFLETPDAGTITVQDKVLFDADHHANCSEKEIRKNRLHFGMVFQSFNLFPQYTALENVTLALSLIHI